MCPNVCLAQKINSRFLPAYLCDAVFCWPALCVAWWSMMASLQSWVRWNSDLFVRCCCMYLRDDEPGETVLSLKHSVYGVAMVGKGNMGDNRTWRSLDSSVSGRMICVNGNKNVETRNLFPSKRFHRGRYSLSENI